MLILLVGCSSANPSNPRASPSVSHPNPPDLTQPLGEYAGAPCALLDGDEDRAAYRITMPGRVIDLSEGPAESCYWLVSTGVQITWIPYPHEKTWRANADDPGARRFYIAGYPVVQTADKESCYQNVIVGSSDSVLSSGSFSMLVRRTESDAPKDLCGIATLLSELIITKLQLGLSN
ncbi:DUF3558 family protein [Nonomuraea sp. NPDC049400]|uniref:DUF3558 family protein n=1 Tax=Nonomuraea sp. NPDC049400 TaxID=3364352 RepID=UPI003788DEEA